MHAWPTPRSWLSCLHAQTPPTSYQEDTVYHLWKCKFLLQARSAVISPAFFLQAQDRLAINSNDKDRELTDWPGFRGTGHLHVNQRWTIKSACLMLPMLTELLDLLYWLMHNQVMSQATASSHLDVEAHSLPNPAQLHRHFVPHCN